MPSLCLLPALGIKSKGVLSFFRSLGIIRVLESDEKPSLVLCHIDYKDFQGFSGEQITSPALNESQGRAESLLK